MTSFLHPCTPSRCAIRRRTDEIFGDSVAHSERRNPVTLIYCLDRELSLILRTVDDQEVWHHYTLRQLFQVSRSVIPRYPRDHFEAALTYRSADIIEELLYFGEDVQGKRRCYGSSIETITATNSGAEGVAALTGLIQHLAIARLCRRR